MTLSEKVKFETELCELAYKYGTDKCPRLKHTYTPYYYELLRDKKNTVKKVLELGIGHYKGIKNIKKIYDKGLDRFYYRGASLYMWRDFFPKATIFGADINPETMFTDGRIKTFVCDEKKVEDLVKLIKSVGNDIDLFIDDGSHHFEDQLLTCKTLMPMFKKDIIYIIEDVGFTKRFPSNLPEYNCFAPNIANRHSGNQLIVVKHI